MNLQKILRPVVIGLLFLIPVFPLIVVDSFFFPFITGKGFYFRIIVELAFFGWVILAFLDAKYRPTLRPITVAVTLFAVVTLLADLLGVNPLRSFWSNFERMEGWLVVLHLWMFLVTILHMFRADMGGHRMWHRWLNFSLVISSIVGLHGIAQLLGSSEWLAGALPNLAKSLKDAFPIHQGSIRIDASLGNAAYMAVYMLIHAFIAGYMFFAIRGKRIVEGAFPHYGYAVLSIIFMFLVYQTGTRGTAIGLVGGVILTSVLYSLFANGITRNKVFAFFGFVVASVASFCAYAFLSASAWAIIAVVGASYVALLVYLLVSHKEAHEKGSRWIAFGVITFIMIVGAAFYSVKDTDYVKNHPILSRLASISVNETKTQARGYIWPMALTGFEQRPILGWGQENFNYIFNTNYNPKMWSQEQWFDRAHNVYLDWLTASGAVGLLVYLSLYVLAFVAIWKSVITLKEKSILTGLVAAYAVHNVFVFDNLASYVLFFAVLGFLASLHEGKQIKLFGSEPLRMDAVEYIVAPIVLVLLVGSLYLFNIRPIQANIGLIKALQACSSQQPDVTKFGDALALDQYIANQEIREQLLSCSNAVISSSLPLTLRQGFLTFTGSEIEKQISATPKDTRVYALAGSFYNSIGQIQLAEPLLEEAAKLSPNKQSIELQLVNTYANSGKTDKALAILEKFYELTPEHPGVRDAYIKVLIIAGREAEARSKFADSEVFETEGVAQIYVSLKKYSQATALYEKLIAADPTNLELRARYIRYLADAGMKWQAINVTRKLIVDFPEVKKEAELLIKQIETAK